ncbi:MAG: MAPEG family protein, partial [Steroidobacteraceae bacterium]
MSGNLIFGPVLAQVLLTLIVYVLLIREKIRAIKAGQVNKERRPLYDDAWPESVIQINNNLRNQYEVPVLFYVVSIVLWALEAVGIAALAAAWLFVA